MAVDDLPRVPGGSGEREEQSLLAAERVPDLLGDRGNLELAHAGLHGRERSAHGLVLRGRGRAHQLHLIRRS